MAFPACLATRRATWARGARKQKARRLPHGSRRVVKGSPRLWRSTATVKAEAAGEQTEDDQDDPDQGVARSEEHTSELQSRLHLVCRLLLEKKKERQTKPPT